VLKTAAVARNLQISGPIKNSRVIIGVFIATQIQLQYGAGLANQPLNAGHRL